MKDQVIHLQSPHNHNKTLCGQEREKGITMTRDQRQATCPICLLVARNEI